ncbi:MAG: hypothetical protein Q8K99_07415 [Actinomycetota bacterium]|nr:hypothetical protein [Actinomycetota bacterium]
MARLPIKNSVLSRLFAMSGNLCAHPTCAQILYRDDGTGFVNICHIHSAEAGWTRHDPLLSDEALRAIDNLILLCPNHHGEIDQQYSIVSADDLRQWKRRHEARFTDMRLLFDPQIIDRVGSRAPVKPSNMGQLAQTHPDHFLGSDLPEIAVEMCAFVDRIRNIPPPTIEFMIRALQHGLRGAASETWGSFAMKLDANEIAQAFDLTGAQVTEFCAIMERYGVGYLEDDYPARVGIASPAEHMDWGTFNEALISLGGDLETLLQVQDFSIFDV